MKIQKNSDNLETSEEFHYATLFYINKYIYNYIYIITLVLPIFNLVFRLNKSFPVKHHRPYLKCYCFQAAIVFT